MNVTLFGIGYCPINGLWSYNVLCDNGVAFSINEPAYYKTGTRLMLPDDMCAFDSGWVYWQCEMCGIQHWTRTIGGGSITCPSCGNIETCPIEVILMPYEGADSLEDDEV